MTTLRALLAVTGVAAMAYAVTGLLTDPDGRPAGTVAFLAAVLVAHDAIWLPLVLVIGVLVTRRVPSRLRPAIRVLLLCAAATAAVGLPLLLSPGRPPGTAPHPAGYAAIALAVLATATLPVLTGGRKKTERTGAGDSSPDDG